MIQKLIIGGSLISLGVSIFFYNKSNKLQKKIKKLHQKISTFQQNEQKSNEFKPIGYLESCYTARNYTPNQSTRVPSSKARIKLDVSFSKYKEGSFDTFEQFSHCWVIFIFHENTNLTIKGKILPPRKKDNQKVGVFSCRSPHRPNPIGLSLVKIDKIENGYVYLSSLDLIDGTPILDLKPYIPSHDYVQNPKIADWVELTSKMDSDFQEVIIDEQVQNKIQNFNLGDLYQNSDQILQTLKETLQFDGRKKYSKEANHWIINLSKIDFYCKIYENKVIVFDVIPYTYPIKK